MPVVVSESPIISDIGIFIGFILVQRVSHPYDKGRLCEESVAIIAGPHRFQKISWRRLAVNMLQNFRKIVIEDVSDVGHVERSEKRVVYVGVESCYDIRN